MRIKTHPPVDIKNLKKDRFEYFTGIKCMERPARKYPPTLPRFLHELYKPSNNKNQFFNLTYPNSKTKNKKKIE